MKPIHLLLILLLVFPRASAFPQDQASMNLMCQSPEGFRLQDGTGIKLRTTQTVSSADAKVDDRIDFEVLEEISVCDTVVIAKGATAWGTVVEAQAKRRMGRGGKLNVTIEGVRLVNGDKVALRAVRETSGKGSGGAMTAGIVATSLIVWPAAPFFLFMKGKDITIPKGTEITAYVRGDSNLDAAKFQTAPAKGPAVAAQESSQPTPPAAAAVGPLSTVVIASTPDGAEITVNGKYMGSTPSTIRLAPGDYSISIGKGGFRPWQRTMTVTPGGDVAIDASLEKGP